MRWLIPFSILFACSGKDGTNIQEGDVDADSDADTDADTDTDTDTDADTDSDADTDADTDTDADADTDTDTDADADTDTDADTDPVCTTTVIDGFPTNGAVDVYYRTDVNFTFSDMDPTAMVSVTDSNGNVPGTTAWSNNTLVFTADEPFETLTEYTAIASYCAGDEFVLSTFTTSEIGDPVPGALDGRAYALDIGSGQWVSPPGVGALLGSQLTASILLGVQSTSGTTLNVLGAVGDINTNEQDVCAETIPFPAADFSANPFFEVGPATIDLDIQGLDITIEEMVVSGAFAPDGSEIVGGVFRGIIDTRALVPLIDPSGGPDAVCNLVAAFGVTCDPCPSGGDFCLTLEVIDLDAPELPAGLVERTAADIANDPTCAP